MKTKIIACFSAVLLTIGAACAPLPPPPPPVRPLDPPLPAKCPVLELQLSIPARCCALLCDDDVKYPEAAYSRCEERYFDKYNCRTDERAIIHFMMFNCKCK